MRAIQWTVLFFSISLGAGLRGQEPGDLFDNVVDTLTRRFYDREFRREVLPGLERKFRPMAEAAESLAEECAVVDGLLSHVPSSHLALYSKATFQSMIAELSGRRQWTFGFQIKQRASRFFADKILEGGPADRAGLRRGDRIVRIDGKRPHASPRLDRRSDDAYLPDAPLHAVLVAAKEDRDPDEEGVDVLNLVVERSPGVPARVTVTAARFSAVDAARNSVRVIEAGGQRFGYVHFWYIHAGCARILTENFRGRFADCDALILDLRGRGGNGLEARRIVDLFTGKRRRWTRPCVLLLDKESRSAKEMIGYELKTRGVATVIGERTAGALVPASFARVGQELVLMLPATRLPRYSDAVELIGIEPDVKVVDSLPFSAGRDRILERALAHLAAQR